MKRAGWAAAFFILFPLAAAAEQSPVKAEARVWQAQATLGDEIRVSVQVEHPRDFSVIPPSPQTPLSPFEIKKIEFSPFRVGKNRVRETLDLTLTVFELGELKIPPIAVTAKSDTGRTVEVRTEPLAVKIVSVGKRVSDKDDIRPIKGPIRVGFRHLRQAALEGLLVFLCVLLAVRIGMRWRAEWLLGDSRKAPHERARLELGRLKDRGLLEEGKVKEFYSELADILRRYLERRFGVIAMELTTAEILDNLKGRPVDPSATPKIKRVFLNSDLVKFAKFVPPRALAAEMEKELMLIVESTKLEGTDNDAEADTRFKKIPDALVS